MNNIGQLLWEPVKDIECDIEDAVDDPILDLISESIATTKLASLGWNLCQWIAAHEKS